MKIHRMIAPLAFLVVPGIVLAQQGDHHDRHVRQDQHARAEAGSVDPRYTRPQVDRRYDRRPTTLSHGDMTRSLRADERARDVIAHEKKVARRHRKYYKKH